MGDRILLPSPPGSERVVLLLVLLLLLVLVPVLLLVLLLEAMGWRVRVGSLVGIEYEYRPAG